MSAGTLMGSSAVEGEQVALEAEFVVVEERGALYGGLQRCSEVVKDAMYHAFGLAAGGKKKKRTLADTLWRLPAPSRPQNPMHGSADARRGSVDEAEEAEDGSTAKLLVIAAASARAVLLLEPWVREQAEGAWGRKNLVSHAAWGAAQVDDTLYSRTHARAHIRTH